MPYKINNIIKRLISFTFIVVFLFVLIQWSTVSAEDSTPISMSISVDNGVWTISGITKSDITTSILIKDSDSNIKYINEKKSNLDGSYTFSVPLPETAYYSFRVGGTDIYESVNRILSDELFVQDLTISSRTEQDLSRVIVASTTLHNFTGETKEAWLLLSVYKGNKLVDVCTQKCDPVIKDEDGSISVEYNVPDNAGDYCYKAFVWASPVSMKPISKVTEYSLRSVKNPYEAVNWQTFGKYKANFHTHTVRSDGGNTPAEMIDAYYNKGYGILAITDHDFPNQQSCNQITYPWTDYDRNPDALNMVDIQGQEISYSVHHLLSLFNDYPGNASGNIDTALQSIGERNGIAVWAHPRQFNYTTSWYVDSYRKYDHLIGMEVINQLDRHGGSANRELWDQVLSELLPDKTVWGFADDDAHDSWSTGLSWNVLILSELTDDAVRNAIETGQFYFASKYTVPNPTGSSPEINSINVNKAAGSITITGSNYNTITWISEGNVIHTGETLEYAKMQNIGKYVRAVLTGPGGEAFTQPFEVVE